METILETQNLSFSYGDTPVLKNINVSIRKGERIAVLGANGAGKSTFFLNLNGVRIPDQGAVYYHGVKIEKKNLNTLRQNVGIVFQDADHQIVASTVKAEIAFGPMNMHLERAEVEKRVEDAVSQMKLQDYVNRPPHYLSGGEKKKVSIADILAMHSEIIIFDEPTASLDPATAQMLEEVLNRLEQEGKTILLSTHDIDFAYRFADRVLVFQEGELIGDDVPEKIFHQTELLQRTHLKKPVLMEVWEILQEHGKMTEEGRKKQTDTEKQTDTKKDEDTHRRTGFEKQEGTDYMKRTPRNIEEFRRMLALTLVCMILAVTPVANAMHIMEGYLPPQFCIAWGILCIPFLVWGFRTMEKKLQENRRNITLLAMAGAFIFVISSLKVPSVTGSCSHMTGTGLGAILFGPSVVSILGIIVLIFQAILLAHGGLTTLGANTFSMAIAGPFLSYGIYILCKKCKVNKHVGIFLAAFLGDIFTYCVTSLELAMAYPAQNGGVRLSMLKFLGVFAPTQLPLAVLEGILTVLIMIALETYAGEELKMAGYFGGKAENGKQ